VRFVYDVPRAGDVSLRVFDVSGRSVRTLAKGPVEAGSWSATWDGRDESGRRAAAGVYIARLRTQSGARTVKFAYVR
jgi:flagellar hook assembly protein FlgD